MPSIATVIATIDRIILGKSQQIQLALICILAGGHLLIEDQPGVGKTTLAHTLAKVLGLSFNRLQFTSDLLPGDVLGVSIFDTQQQSFQFHHGPVFTHFLLADEINRATPKTQSALLESMAEKQVTIDGQTYPLPEPFFVIATQNPMQQIGTYALPESQLDRFLMRIELGYPDKQAEKRLLCGEDRRQLLQQIDALLSPSSLLNMQQQVTNTHASEAVIEYLQAILDYSRHSGQFKTGLSPRAGIAILQAAKACAWVNGAGYVLPEHIKTVLAATVNHRLALSTDTVPDDAEVDLLDPARVILQHVSIP